MRIALFSLLFCFFPSIAFAQIFQVEFQAKNLQTLDEGRVVYGSDGVTLSFFETRIEADEVLVFREEGRILCEGNVRMSRPGVGVLASSILIDFYSGYFEMEKPSGFFSMEEFTHELLYFTGSTMRGDPNRFIVEDAIMTSCAANCPREYYFKASKVVVKPGKLLEAWNAIFSIAGIPLLYFPYFLADLKRRETGIDFVVGKNKREGLFVRSNYTFLNKAPLIAAVALNYVEKTGNELGLSYKDKVKWFGEESGDYSFRTNKKKAGMGKNTQIKVSQGFRFGDWKGKIDYDRSFQITQVGYGTGRTETKRLNFNLTPPKSKWTLTYNQNDTGSGMQRTTRSNTTLNIPKLQFLFLPLTVNFRMDASKTGTSPKDEEGVLTITSTSKKAGRLFSSWNVKFDKRFDLDGPSYTQDSSQQLQNRVPEFIATFNPKIWSGTFLGEVLYLSGARLTISRWQQGPRNAPKKSSFAELSLDQRKEWSFFNKAVQLTFTQNFLQAYYRTHDARFSYRPTLTLKLTPWKIWTLTSTYTYSKERGGDPFTQPRTGNSENLNLNSVLAKGKKWNFTSGTQYDLKSKRRQPISLNLRYLPSKNSEISLTSSYNRNTRDFGNIAFRYNLRKVPITDFNFALTYDPVKHKITTFNYSLAQRLPRGFSIQTKSQYNRPKGFRVMQEIILTKQNCCTYWQLSWKHLNKEILFKWGVTAFPHDFFKLSAGDEGLFLRTYPEELLEQMAQKGIGTGTTGAPTTPQ